MLPYIWIRNEPERIVLIILPGSPFVNSNTYDIFEIPDRKRRKFPLLGNFLIVAHNVTYDHWIFARMRYSLDFEKSIQHDKLYESVSYSVMGSYDLRSENDMFYVTKKDSPHKIYYERNTRTVYFDKFRSKKSCLWIKQI